MKHSKRGVSEALMFVFFLGFAVALAGLVFFYQKDFVNDEISGSVRFGESRLECDDVFLNALHRNELTTDGSCWVRFTNTGAHTIAGVALRDVTPGAVSGGSLVILSKDNSAVFPLKPKDSFWDDSLSYSSSKSTMEAVPFIELEGQRYACDKKIVEVSCAPPASAVANNECEENEGCEWNNSTSEQMLCDGKRSPIPSGATCSGLKIYSSSSPSW